MSEAATDEDRQPRRRILYGRRQGPKLRPARRRLLEERLPALGFTVGPGHELDPFSLFVRPPRAIWLEIGFGGGEHLAEQAASHPDVGFLGVEPFLNGVARLIDAVDARGLGNVRVLMDDARLLLEALPDASIERAFVLFPDPWPKARHHKRRIVNPVTVAELARVMRAGGELRLASDDPGYVRWMLATMLAEQRFAWLAERAADWRERPADWPPTRYEEKALRAGRRPVFLRFERVSAA
ncbi:tRNA (guanosine(46)-N7)-methyltransferase TrmB [Benzoatithermus flavus]|uniref:tRNA (guanine-N(7)-)-methyltransferase n=1 Tax=Benzoatithermus flavus TaxID=3108223 RepID=A0ABU8XV41_9PROT